MDVARQVVDLRYQTQLGSLFYPLSESHFCCLHLCCSHPANKEGSSAANTSSAQDCEIDRATTLPARDVARQVVDLRYQTQLGSLFYPLSESHFCCLHFGAYVVPIQPTKKDRLPRTLQALKTVKLIVPPLYPQVVDLRYQTQLGSLFYPLSESHFCCLHFGAFDSPLPKEQEPAGDVPSTFEEDEDENVEEPTNAPAAPLTQDSSSEHSSSS
jgi:hypothetical protein